MNTKRLMLKIVSVCLISAMLFSGCKGKEKKTKRDTTDIRHAEAMLDDFCAYLKSGKLDKLEKLIDGESDWLGKIADMKSSVGKELVDACLSRMKYDFEDTSASEDDEEGESTVVITYFETKDVKKETEADSSLTEIENLIDDAEEIEIEFNVDLVFDDDWLIKSKSVDTICKELFGFLEEYDLMNEAMPTSPDPTTPTMDPFEYFYSCWYDEKYNEVNGYYESTDYVNLYVITYSFYSNVTVTYDYTDDNGKVVYEGEYTFGYSDDAIYCEWYPSSKLPVGDLTCRVYDPNGDCFACETITIYDDDDVIPVDVYCYNLYMMDEMNMPVPGFHESDTVMKVHGTAYSSADEATMHYSVYELHGYSYDSDDLICEDDFIVYDANENGSFVVEWGNQPLEKGDYVIVFEDMTGETQGTVYFEVIADDDEFESDDDTAEIYYTCWYKEMNSCYEISSITQGTDSVVFEIMTVDYYSCMGFDYELVGPDGKTLQEGKFYIVNYEDYVQIEFTGLADCEKGEITLTIYNPDGSELTEETLKVK